MFPGIGLDMLIAFIVEVSISHNLPNVLRQEAIYHHRQCERRSMSNSQQLDLHLVK